LGPDLGSRGIEAPSFVLGGISDPQDEDEASLFAAGAWFELVVVVAAFWVVNLSGRLSALDCVCPLCVGFDEKASSPNVVGSIAVGEKAEVTDAGEAGWENVEKEPPEELVGAQRHGSSGVAVRVVFPSEGNCGVVGR
jgi:hypothetical protein